jgi:hypothetical protein
MAENYILVAGTAGGGGAPFRNHVVRYLLSAKESFRAGLVAADGRDSLNIQDALWSEGAEDCAYRVQPLGKHKDKPPLDFAFFEVPGTDLKALLAAEAGAASALPGELPGLLGNPKLNFVLVLLCDSNTELNRDGDALDQDSSLARFVARLKSNFGEEFASRCPVLLLASKTLDDAESSRDVSAFVSDNLPATLAALEDWKGRYTLGELTFGDCVDAEPHLPQPEFEETARIFRWIYFQFTRQPVAEPVFARLWKGIRKSVS